MNPQFVERVIDALDYTEKLSGREYISAAVWLCIERPRLINDNYVFFLVELAGRLDTTPERVDFVLNRTAASSWQSGRLFMLFERGKRYSDEREIITAIASAIICGMNADGCSRLIGILESGSYDERIYREMIDSGAAPISYTDI